jgi:hypothetical protein
MDFTPLSIDTSPIIQMTYNQIENDFGFSKMLSKHVFAAETDYAIKIIAKSDKHLSNEISVSNQLIALFKHTQIFQYTYGYVLCTELPPNVTPIDQDFGYIYLFSELIDQTFDKLPDEPKNKRRLLFRNSYWNLFCAKTAQIHTMGHPHWQSHVQRT